MDLVTSLDNELMEIEKLFNDCRDQQVEFQKVDSSFFSIFEALRISPGFPVMAPWSEFRSILLETLQIE